MKKTLVYLLLFTAGACNTTVEVSEDTEDHTPQFTLEAEDAGITSETAETGNDSVITIYPGGWAIYKIDVPKTGRYRLEATLKSSGTGHIWVEDYIDNKDDRTYNITGAMRAGGDEGFQSASIDGSPLKKGAHSIKVHAEGDTVVLDAINFILMKPHIGTPGYLTQSMEGKDWKIVWRDEFSGSGLPDSTRWSYNIGNWGWGNNEPQYYTEKRTQNARLEDGNLIIEARKNDIGQPWTSARLTTQGKQSFLYGRIEIRAKVPEGRGTWAAGWMLGDSYEDELSWPYCGEIDILECVGYEIDDSTGNGRNHATCHTPKYYFKKGNQISGQIELEMMNDVFHTYAVEWYPDVIYGLVDGERYYTYDKNADELEWPFDQPQNIILNLAVGGGWGGAKGIDENWEKHQFIIDYVRVYELSDE